MVSGTTTITGGLGGADHEIYCLLVPLADDRLLLPRSCVTEVINYQAPTPMDGAPPWYLGTIAWGGRRVPLVVNEAPLIPDFEQLEGMIAEETRA